MNGKRKKIFIGQINTTVGALSSNAALIRRAYDDGARRRRRGDGSGIGGGGLSAARSARLSRDTPTFQP
jgi:hypothetical protein